jgi:cell pole-organizing protein PopZ
MGDISAEPSMEDILSSIKRIIAEEGETATAASRARRPLRSMAPRHERASFGHDEILELSDPVPATDEEAPAPFDPLPVDQIPLDQLSDDEAPLDQVAADHAIDAEDAPLPTPTSTISPIADPLPSPRAPADPIVSPRAAEASRGALDALSRLIVKPEVAGTDTLEGLVREMIRPMLREWLDANLPAMVETMVSQEIARITGNR